MLRRRKTERLVAFMAGYRLVWFGLVFSFVCLLRYSTDMYFGRASAARLIVGGVTLLHIVREFFFLSFFWYVLDRYSSGEITFIDTYLYMHFCSAQCRLGLTHLIYS